MTALYWWLIHVAENQRSSEEEVQERDSRNHTDKRRETRERDLRNTHKDTKQTSSTCINTVKSQKEDLGSIVLDGGLYDVLDLLVEVFGIALVNFSSDYAGLIQRNVHSQYTIQVINLVLQQF